MKARVMICIFLALALIAAQNVEPRPEVLGGDFLYNGTTPY